jgi:reverse gyrase
MSYATEEYRKVLEERRRQVEQQMQKVEFGKVEGK